MRRVAGEGLEFPMKTPRSRSLDAWDGSILVLATVAAMGISYVLIAIPPPDAEESGALERAISIARAFLMAWTLAIAALGWRRPRPARARLCRQSGMAACLVAATVLVGLILGYLRTFPLVAWNATATGWRTVPDPTIPASPVVVRTTPAEELRLTLGFLVSDTAYAEGAIAGAWLIMALGGWWRPEASGLDRLGRAVGAAWIAIMVVGWIAGLL
jgi:hypothetical protein